MISFQLDATPICGLTQSSSPMPTARSIPRAAAFSRPSVTSRERGLMSCSVMSERRPDGVDDPAGFSARPRGAVSANSCTLSSEYCRRRCRGPAATWAAVAQPSSAAPRRSRPSESPRRKPAENASPQPVVSTTSTAYAGTSITSSAVTTSAPCAPCGDGDAADAALDQRPGALGEVAAPVKPSTCSSLGSR